MKYIKIKNSSPAGDLISMLAGVKQICKDQDAKAIIYQRINMIGQGYEGAEHPYKNENDEPITMNKTVFDKIKPLLEAQDYIHSYELYEGQGFDMDFDKCMLEIYTGAPKGSLARYLFHVYPQTATDLSEDWLSRDTLLDYAIEYEGKIIINFTFRYRNYLMDYSFLKGYEQNLIFAGLPKEHESFCKQWDLDIPLLKDRDFLDFAQILSCCKFFIGNASVCYHIAEALKIPRMLEIFPLMPHVIPQGDNAYDFYHNDEARFYFNKLLNL